MAPGARPSRSAARVLRSAAHESAVHLLLGLVLAIGPLFKTTMPSAPQAQVPGAAAPSIPRALVDSKAVSPILECSELVTADLASAVGARTVIRAATAVTDGRPAPYCRVQGTIDPAIQFEVRLPLQNWTQRFLQTGCGGLCGTLNINVSRGEGCAPATNGEIALASTDMGHSGGGTADPTWAVENPQARIDFAYRGVHLTAVAAKALIRKYYGQPAAVLLLQRVLGRRARGVDGGAALPGRLRRHRRRRARDELHHPEHLLPRAGMRARTPARTARAILTRTSCRCCTGRPWRRATRLDGLVDGSSRIPGLRIRSVGDDLQTGAG